MNKIQEYQEIIYTFRGIGNSYKSVICVGDSKDTARADAEVKFAILTIIRPGLCKFFIIDINYTIANVGIKVGTSWGNSWE